MAGGKLYVSEMLEDLQEGMNSMREDMANMVEKMLIVAENTAETAKIIGSSVSTIFIEASETAEEAENTVVVMQPDTKIDKVSVDGRKIATYTPKCNGSVLVSYKIHIQGASSNATYSMLIGGKTVFSKAVNYNSSAVVEGTFLLNGINSDVPFEFMLDTTANTSAVFTINELSMHYDIADATKNPFVLS